MKRIVALVVAGLFLIAAVPADARGGRGGGHSGGGHSVRHGGHSVRHGGFHGNRFHGHGHRFHHHGFRGGFVVGTGLYLGPYWYPSYYPYYPYYPYEPVSVVTEPQTYIEQTPAQSYWYYCEEAKAYYPYVQQCPGGWLTVVPQAAPEPR